MNAQLCDVCVEITGCCEDIFCPSLIEIAVTTDPDMDPDADPEQANEI